ncbi:MAG: aminotransferase class I/II-fold pyridoxal phosphate-dependent enzyme [Actinobacteria bacterium]|nr:aminotransferase class I/II-fold pyridoxal phosphate-dependent enzyme [Actinomycetota bacterium]
MSQFRIKAPPLSQLQTHRSEKWREFPADVLPLPVAEMDFPVADPIRNVLLEMVAKSDLGYLGPIPELPVAFGSFAKKRWNWTLDPEQVRIATDVGVAAVEVLRLVTSPGDRVLINTPVYHNFANWIKEAGLELVDVPFHQVGQKWELDFSLIEQAYKSDIKVHLLCNPHNPLGRTYSPNELLEFATLAKKYEVVIISDEIHGPLTYQEATFTPFLSLGSIAEEVGVTITAASKAWNIAGLKCAIIVSQNSNMDAVLSRLPVATHYRASLLGAFATVAAFADGEEWLDAVMIELDSNRNLLKRLLVEKLPQVGYELPQMGYLAWLDFSDYAKSRPAHLMLTKGKVAVNPGSSFGPNVEGFVRLNFATSPEILTNAIERIVVALK